MRHGRHPSESTERPRWHTWTIVAPPFTTPSHLVSKQARSDDAVARAYASDRPSPRASHRRVTAKRTARGLPPGERRPICYNGNPTFHIILYLHHTAASPQASVDRVEAAVAAQTPLLRALFEVGRDAVVGRIRLASLCNETSLSRRAANARSPRCCEADRASRENSGARRSGPASLL